MRHPGGEAAEFLAERFFGSGKSGLSMYSKFRATSADLPSVEKMRQKLDAFYAKKPSDPYRTRLVPHIWGEASVSFTPAGPKSWARPRLGAMRHILLYANGIELSDPLPELLSRLSAKLKANEASFDTWADPRFTSDLRDACAMWLEVSQLVEENAIFMVPWRPAEGWAGHHAIASHLIWEAATDWRFRAEYARIVADVDGTEDFDEGFDKRFLGPPRNRVENEEATDAFQRSQMTDDYLVQVSYLYAGIENVLHSQALGQGAAWFPDEYTFRIVRALAVSQDTVPGLSRTLRGTWKDREALAAVASIDMPSLAQLDLKTLIALRRNDEVFGMWRDHLHKALQEFKRPDVGAAGVLYFEEYLREAAQELDARLRRQRKSLLVGNLRHVGIAALGGAIGGLTGGVPGTALGASGAVVAGVLETVTDGGVSPKMRRYSRAIRAAAETAMFLGGASPG